MCISQQQMKAKMSQMTGTQCEAYWPSKLPSTVFYDKSNGDPVITCNICQPTQPLPHLLCTRTALSLPLILQWGTNQWQNLGLHNAYLKKKSLTPLLETSFFK
jgi:hypothetical protein